MSTNFEDRMYLYGCVQRRAGKWRCQLILRSDQGRRTRRTDQGEDFADIEAANLEGLASARELLADAAKKGILATSPVYLIRNAAGDILATVPFRRPQTRLSALGPAAADNVTHSRRTAR